MMWIFFAAALLDFLCRNQCAQALKTVGRNQPCGSGAPLCARYFSMIVKLEILTFQIMDNGINI
jgi:hypothetical protein